MLPPILTNNNTTKKLLINSLLLQSAVLTGGLYNYLFYFVRFGAKTDVLTAERGPVTSGCPPGLARVSRLAEPMEAPERPTRAANPGCRPAPRSRHSPAGWTPTLWHPTRRNVLKACRVRSGQVPDPPLRGWSRWRRRNGPREQHIPGAALLLAAALTSRLDPHPLAPDPS